MTKNELFAQAVSKYRSWYGKEPRAAAYAPGRAEILGNHTDYNEGYVLSVAISFGTFFLAGEPSKADTCRLVAGDLMREVTFPVEHAKPFTEMSWPNYVMGVAAGLREQGAGCGAFDGLFFGNVPLGSGLSSSAALEISAGLALNALGGTTLPPLDLARIGQAAEHHFVGAKTGLLDQISSLYGEEDRLVLSDFRSLEVSTVPLPPDVCFLVCDTGTKHSHVDSEYNRRREACERAASFFAAHLERRVTALRDVTWKDWQRLSSDMDAEAASRSAHVIGENSRVLAGKELLAAGDVRSFGRLMFESHDSSRKHFENSCVELDFLVDAARRQKSVMGARLSGGGFGGSAVMLLEPTEVEAVTAALGDRYEREFGYRFEARVVEASPGARVVALPE